MRYGKPIKNKKRIDPRYFLSEVLEADAAEEEEKNRMQKKLNNALSQMNTLLNGGRTGKGFLKFLLDAANGNYSNAADIADEAGWVNQLVNYSNQLRGPFVHNNLDSRLIERLIESLKEAPKFLQDNDTSGLLGAENWISYFFGGIVGQLFDAKIINKRPWES